MRVVWLAILILFFVSTNVLSQIIAREGQGFLEKRDGLLVLHLSGTPYERVYQHGKLLREKIQGLISAYIEGQVKKTISEEMLTSAARKTEKFILEEFKEEMKGIAEGADVPYEKIRASHIFLDLYVNPNQQRLKKMLFQCSNFAVFGKATKDKKIIHGRNLDWFDWGILSDYAVVIFAKPDSGNAYISVGWPGCVGVLTGMNEKNISLGQMVVKGSDNQIEGVPHFFLMRQVVQYASSLEEAEKILKEAPRTTCWNVVISDGKVPSAILVEYSAKNISVIKPKDGVIYSTNHFVSDTLKEQMKIYPPTNNSLARHIRLEELIGENYGKIDKEKAIKFLGDHFNPYEKKEIPHYNTICQSTTIQSVVFLPQTLELYLSCGIKAPVTHGKYHYFDFKKEIKRKIDK